MANRRITRIVSGFTLVFLALAGLALVWRSVIVSASTPSQVVQTQVAPGTEPGMRSADQTSPDSPAISFIDSPSATCYLPVKGTNACFIQWNYLNVTASTSQYIISMTVAIDGRIRAYYSGFFQNSMYVPTDLIPTGFRVDCGTPGSSGNPDLGKSYAYTLRSRETGGLSAANYGTVFCPADVVLIDRMSLTDPQKGYVNTSYNFNAALLPVTTTLPVTYTWLASGYPPQVTAGGLTTARSFTWTTPGVVTVTLKAQNLGNLVSKTISINIQPHFIYLPYTQRR
jgi:hypothetical protein